MTLAAFFTASRANSQVVQMLDDDEAIALEHDTRSARLRRLVREQSVRPPPEFQDYVIPARSMPTGFKHATPVLRVVFPDSTFFETGATEVLTSAYPIIRAMAAMLEGDVPDVATFVAGHADNRGSESYNHSLSVRRAHSVAAALRDAGANNPDIWSVGFGESLPLYENSSPANMSFNRRVEFLFGARPEAVARLLTDQMDFACSASGLEAKQRCLVALKVRPRYVVQAVARTTVVAQPRPAPGATVGPPDPKVTLRSKPRQIVINLAERTYVVARPES